MKAERPMADRNSLDDPALAAAICGGDDAALEEAYRRHGGAVWAIARRVCREPAMAEDVAQVVFTDLWARPGRYDPQRASLRTWLVTHAHGRAVDAVRSEAARRRREGRDAHLAPTTTPNDPETTVGTARLADGVHRALARLPEPQRQALVLAYFDGHTYQETARLLATPEGTIKSRIRLALGTLRRALAAEEMAP
jgi:RNA polymerase sigma-70 factor (ECF subfamily)